MGRPIIYYNGRASRWEVLGKGGILKEAFDDADNAIIRKIKFVGTVGGIAAVGTLAMAIGTITGATGLLPGDVIFGVPKAALGGNVGLGGFHVPTNNTLNVYIQNVSGLSAGSLPATGFDIAALRF